jgi:hypothetical protein
MNHILNNPYRVIGILAGTSLAAQTSHLNRLKMYLDAEQEPKSDFSFPVLGTLTRTVDSVNEASAKIGLDKDKLEASLFWLYNGNDITDEPAFDALKEADIQAAYDIWSKRTAAGTITETNASAFQNLSSLLFFICLKGRGLNENYLKEGLNLKIKFLESEYFSSFKSKVSDNTYQPTKKEVQLIFLNALLEDLRKHSEVHSTVVIEILSKLSFSAKEDFFKTLTQKPIQQIEAKIETAKSKRKANKAQAANAGKELYNTVSDDVELLRKLSGSNDLRFTSISDKVADEILQCGIDYFLHYRDTETDPSSATMDLFKKAKSFAVGRIITQRCQENTENVQEWIDDKPDREKQQKIKADLEFITAKLERFQELNDTIANAKDLAESCKYKLQNIRTSLGSYDEFYLKISSAVVNNVMGMLVTVVNDEQELFGYSMDPNKINSDEFIAIAIRRFGRNVDIKSLISKMLHVDSYTAMFNLKNVVREALSVSSYIGSFDMTAELKSRYNKNHSTVSSIASQLGSSGPTRPTSPTGPRGPEEFDFNKNAWWILGVAGVFIGGIIGAGGGAMVFGIIGVIVGSQFNK